MPSQRVSPGSVHRSRAGCVGRLQYSVKPSSVRPSQSSSRPLQTSVRAVSLMIWAKAAARSDLLTALKALVRPVPPAAAMPLSVVEVNAKPMV